MATFFNSSIIGYWGSNPSNYIYGTLTGDVSRSGNTVTLSNMWLSVWFRYSAYGSGSYTFTVNGTGTTWNMDAGSPSHGLNNTSFNVSTSQTSATVGWSGSDGYSGSFNVSFAAGTTPPSGLSCSLVSVSSSGAEFDVKVTSWGSPSGSSDRYFEAGIMNHSGDYGGPYIYKHGTHGIAANTTQRILVSNSSKESPSTISISPNTRYYYGAWATNTKSDTSMIFGTLVTLPEPLASISATDMGDFTAKVFFTTSQDGGFYAKDIEYSLNGSSWRPGRTVSSGSVTSGSFLVAGLTPGTVNRIYIRIWTESGIVDCGSVTVSAGSRNSTKIYCSVQEMAMPMAKFIASVNKKKKDCYKIYGSENGETKLLFREWHRDNEIGMYGTLYYMDGNKEKSYHFSSLEDFNLLCNYAESDDVIGFSGVFVRKYEITGVAFGPIFLKEIGDNFMMNCMGVVRDIVIPDGVTSLGDNCFRNMTSFDGNIILPNTLVSIGEYFMSYCLHFNHSLVLPPSLKSIGYMFMPYVYDFNKPLEVPSSVEYIADSFLYQAYDFMGPLTINTTAVPDPTGYDYEDSLTAYSLEAPSYTEGIVLNGPYAENWIRALPNSSSVGAPRKLILQQ